MNRLYRFFGGRKVALGFIAVAILTVMAFPLHAGFGEYAAAVLGALGLTVGSVAYEDARRAPASEEGP